MKLSICKGCGRPITYGTLPNGKRIPLDAQSEVYDLNEHGIAVRRPHAYASHFGTCSDRARCSDSARFGTCPGCGCKRGATHSPRCSSRVRA